MSLKDANRRVGIWHRHSRPTVGGLFAVAVQSIEEARIVGVAIVGRPVARGAQDGFTCEVLRVCTDGEYNACSILYGACVRAAKALGYRRVLTYTLASESGSSLQASGFLKDAVVAGRAWTTPSRPRRTVDLFGERITPDEDKIRWVWSRP